MVYLTIFYNLIQSDIVVDQIFVCSSLKNGRSLMTKPSERVRWHYCHCGCGGQETVYRGRYFFAGMYETPPYYLFSEHSGKRGFHVGLFSYKNLQALNQGVQENYLQYPRQPKLSWHLCPCGECTRATLCIKGMRFWGKWNAFRRRFELFKSHKGLRIYGRYRSSEVDEVVRAIARRPRPPKKRRLLVPVRITIPQ